LGYGGASPTACARCLEQQEKNNKETGND